MALACHFTMEGKNQGKIEGFCDMEGREGSLIGYWFAHQIEMPHNPMDGFPTAKPGHSPLSIIISHDHAHPNCIRRYAPESTSSALKSSGTG